MKERNVFFGLFVCVMLLFTLNCASSVHYIRFDAGGGNGRVTTGGGGGRGGNEDVTYVQKDSSMVLPGAEGLSFSTNFGDAVFAGWYTFSNGTVTTYQPGDVITPTGSMYLIAKWKLDVDFESVTGFADKFLWLQINAEDGGHYTIELNSDEIIEPQRICYGGRNVTVTLRGTDANRTIRGSNRATSLLSVCQGVTLVLDNNITLQGRSDNEGALVWVGGKLIMNAGSVITGNTAPSGGGVRVSKGGILEMNGGAITNNIADGSGGGVWLAGGSFIMNNGTISGNTVGGVKPNGARYGSGGGVCVGEFIGDGTFIMNGGTITGNTSGYEGGGVSGNFQHRGGTVSGNTPAP